MAQTRFPARAIGLGASVVTRQRDVAAGAPWPISKSKGVLFSIGRLLGEKIMAQLVKVMFAALMLILPAAIAAAGPAEDANAGP